MARLGAGTDQGIEQAAQALAGGDPLAALNLVALRDDAPALALRGIAMAQLGDYDKAKALLRRAARSFGAKDPLARARCAVAEAEVAFAARDLAWPPAKLDAARAALAKAGDAANAAHARHLDVRRLLLIGKLDEAERGLGKLDPSPLPPALKAVHELTVAGIALKRLRTRTARAALTRARDAAQRSRIGALIHEIDHAAEALTAPAARVIARGEERLLTLPEVEALFAGKSLVVDACRHRIRDARGSVALARRPVLFALARALAEAWPEDVSRAALIARAFRGKEADASHRARLRVEIGRLRAAIKPLADVQATADGFALTPRRAKDVALLAQPVEDERAGLLALLADGESWSSSALALALGVSQRNVQRDLEELSAQGKAQSFGRGRAQRWTLPPLPGLLSGFTTSLLLPASGADA